MAMSKFPKPKDVTLQQARQLLIEHARLVSHYYGGVPIAVLSIPMRGLRRAVRLLRAKEKP